MAITHRQLFFISTNQKFYIQCNQCDHIEIIRLSNEMYNPDYRNSHCSHSYWECPRCGAKYATEWDPEYKKSARFINKFKLDSVALTNNPVNPNCKIKSVDGVPVPDTPEILTDLWNFKGDVVATEATCPCECHPEIANHKMGRCPIEVLEDKLGEFLTKWEEAIKEKFGG